MSRQGLGFHYEISPKKIFLFFFNMLKLKNPDIAERNFAKFYGKMETLFQERYQVIICYFTINTVLVKNIYSQYLHMFTLDLPKHLLKSRSEDKM